MTGNTSGTNGEASEAQEFEAGTLFGFEAQDEGADGVARDRQTSFAFERVFEDVEPLTDEEFEDARAEVLALAAQADQRAPRGKPRERVTHFMPKGMQEMVVGGLQLQPAYIVDRKLGGIYGAVYRNKQGSPDEKHNSAAGVVVEKIYDWNSRRPAIAAVSGDAAVLKALIASKRPLGSFASVEALPDIMRSDPLLAALRRFGEQMDEYEGSKAFKDGRVGSRFVRTALELGEDSVVYTLVQRAQQNAELHGRIYGAFFEGLRMYEIENSDLIKTGEAHLAAKAAKAAEATDEAEPREDEPAKATV